MSWEAPLMASLDWGYMPAFCTLAPSAGSRGTEQTMMDLKRCGSLAAAFLLAATVLAGCASMGDDSSGIAANAQPDQLTPVTDSSVNSTSLPPIGADGSVQVASATPTDPSATTTPNTGDPALQTTPGTTPTGTAGAPGTQGSFVSLNDVGTTPNGAGRNLAGGLTIEKLLGGWTVVGGATQCHLNLTYTTKTGTSRYRASSPGCQISGLAVVSSWQLSGTQIQLFDDGNKLVGALLLSGNRFIGTLSGGQSISMVG